MTERSIGQTRMKKENLLSKLKENLEKHKTEYQEALTGYRSKVDVELDTVLARWNNQHKLDFTALHQLPIPQDHSEEYELAIAMLDAGEDDEIVLDSEEFKQYYLDKWTWTRHFKDVAGSYTLPPRR